MPGRDIWTNVAPILQAQRRVFPDAMRVWIAVDLGATGFANESEASSAIVHANQAVRAAGFTSVETCRFVPDQRLSEPFSG